MDVKEFATSSEQIWRNVALRHLLTNGSSAVNGCRQNESKQLIKTSQWSTSNQHHSRQTSNLSIEKLRAYKKQIHH